MHLVTNGEVTMHLVTNGEVTMHLVSASPPHCTSVSVSRDKFPCRCPVVVVPPLNRPDPGVAVRGRAWKQMAPGTYGTELLGGDARDGRAGVQAVRGC